MLNACCFAAGTKLNTPNGFRNVEDLTEGDLVYAKNEFDPTAPIEAKPIDSAVGLDLFHGLRVSRGFMEGSPAVLA